MTTSIFWKMEDNLKFLKNWKTNSYILEIFFFKNERQPQKFQKWKSTWIFAQRVNFFGMSPVLLCLISRGVIFYLGLEIMGLAFFSIWFGFSQWFMYRSKLLLYTTPLYSWPLPSAYLASVFSTKPHFAHIPLLYKKAVWGKREERAPQVVGSPDGIIIDLFFP